MLYQRSLQVLAAAAVLCAAAALPAPTERGRSSAETSPVVATSATKAPTPARVECNGTDATSYASVSSVRRRYELYREHYAGCKQVKGDLVLTKLSDPSVAYDMSFLSEIEEIAGYLLIQGVLADEIPLVSLRTIKGRRLYKNFYAVFVENNFLSPAKGLRELQMPKLKSIDRGDVKIGRNPNLCFMENIEWGQLMKEQTSTLDKTSKPGDLATSDKCGHCHANCAKYCWGRGEDMCQDRSTLFLVRSDRNSDRKADGRKPCNNARNCRDGVAAGAVVVVSPAPAGGSRTRKPCTETNRVRCGGQRVPLRKQTTGAPPTATVATATTAAATPTE